jgi:6-bladed beta-propeller
VRAYVVVASMVCGVMLASATAARVSGQAARKPAATIELRRAWTLPSSELPSGDLATIALGVPQQNGSLLLFGPRSSGLLVVDAKGRFSRRIGREGDGPGEYRRISALGRIGDTTFVVDASLRRITLLDRNGTLLRTLPMDQVTQRFQEQYRDLSLDVRPGGLLAHGNVLLESFERPMARDGESESRIEMGVWNPTSGVFRRLAPLKEGALYLSVPGPGRQPLLVRNPLAPRDMRHVQAGGERLVIAQYLGLGKGRVAANLRIVSLAATGETLATRSIEVGLQAISQPEREQLLDEMLGAWGSARVATPEGQAIRRALAERLRAFRWHPPITSLFAAGKDVVWLEIAGTKSGAEWWLLEGASSPRVTVRLPSVQQRRVIAADESGVWAVEDSELTGELQLVRYVLPS